MNRPNTIEGTPVITSMKYRTMFASGDCLPYSVSHSATMIPVGTEITVAKPTISTVPRIALRIPPMLQGGGGGAPGTCGKHWLRFGSLLKNFEPQEPRPLCRR